MSDPEVSCAANCELFGRLAECFESDIVPYWQDVYDQLVARAKIHRNMEVLDAGTGTGEVALRVAKKVGPGGRVVGVDVQREMLDIARRKAEKAKADNSDFRRMTLEGLEFDDSSFDAVVGNYSLCCVLDYRGSLAECLRVLKPGGRLTYNHGGPRDARASTIAFETFEKYKTKRPSRGLAEFRESEAAQTAAVEKYRDRGTTTSLMKSLGYVHVGATKTKRVIKYNDAKDFVDRMLAFDWRNEAEELQKSTVERFKSEAVGKLHPLSKGPGFSLADDMVFFTGIKSGS